MCVSHSPSGTQVTIRHGRWEAVVTEVGAGLRVLTYDGVDKIAGYAPAEQASGGRGQLLIPWPNRIEDGRYEWGGTAQQLPLSEPALHNASHGLTRWVAWRLVEQDPERCTWAYPLRPQPGYPGALDLEVTYAIDDDGLRVDMRATNVGHEAVPYACGAHPYLTVGRSIDECELVVPAQRWCDVDERGLPGPPHPVEGTSRDFRTAARIGSSRIDHPFTDVTRTSGRAVAQLVDPASGRRSELWADEAFAWFQVYTGDKLRSGARESVAVEPMTAPANAFRTGQDLVVLAPGETHGAAWGVR